MSNRLTQQQDLKLQQKLSPMQVQFVRMLEMTGPELESEVRQAVEDMPALEVEDDPQSIDGAEFAESAEQIQRADYASDDDTPQYMLDARNRSASDRYFEPVAINDEPSLAESLLSQLAEADIDGVAEIAAENIIGNLDDNGYLSRSLEAIADDVAFSSGIEIDRRDLEKAFNIVRSLDPAGVGAVDLRDCLLLQLRRKKPTPAIDLAKEIITHYFDLFSKKHFAQLADRLDTDIDSIKEAIAIVAKLNPKPGNQHGDTALEQSGRLIVPEFLVEPDGDNLVVSLLNRIPDLTISRTFTDQNLIPADASPRQRSDAQTFIKTRRDEASVFIKTLQMRQSTLFNIMSAIAAIQREFFFSGDETRLKPMVLKDIAAITGYDLSVISRATSSKYVMTVAGIFPLKFFFNERPKDDDDATFHQIAAAIRKIISEEDKNSPMPDEAITAMLADQGFNIARRTVAKYRERLGFPVARLRRSI